MNTANNFFIWAEKNSTDHQQNLLQNAENVNCDTITETKSGLTKSDASDTIKTKRCSKCTLDLPAKCFRLRTDKRRLRCYCRKCEIAERIKDQKRHPEKWAENSRKYRQSHPERCRRIAHRSVWRNKGLNPDEVEKYLSAHNQCEICGKKETRRGLSVDHCHKSGKFRGVLCSDCNMGLGFFKDEPALFDKAKIYLTRPMASPLS